MKHFFFVCFFVSLFFHTVFFILWIPKNDSVISESSEPVKLTIKDTVRIEKKNETGSPVSDKNRTEDISRKPNDNLLPDFLNTDTFLPVDGITAEDYIAEVKDGGYLSGTVSSLPDGGYYPLPVYPERARIDGIEGTCTFRIEYGPDGGVTDMEIIQSSGSELLDKAAVSAVRGKWRFPEGRPGFVIRDFEFKLIR